MAKQTPTIVHVPALNSRVKKIVTAFGGVEKAQAKLGDIVLEVAATLTQQDIAPFCAMLKMQLEAANPGKESSIKAQVSYIRRVITAVVVDGLKIEPGQTLRGIYDGLPKKKTGGASHARKTADADDGTDALASAPTTLEARAEKVRAAVVMLFGYQEPVLLDAVQFAASNIPAFIEWAQASAQAAQEAAPAPAKKPAAKRARKTAVTA